MSSTTLGLLLIAAGAAAWFVQVGGVARLRTLLVKLSMPATPTVPEVPAPDAPKKSGSVVKRIELWEQLRIQCAGDGCDEAVAKLDLVFPDLIKSTK